MADSGPNNKRTLLLHGSSRERFLAIAASEGSPRGLDCVPRRLHEHFNYLYFYPISAILHGSLPWMYVKSYLKPLCNPALPRLIPASTRLIKSTSRSMGVFPDVTTQIRLMERMKGNPVDILVNHAAERIIVYAWRCGCRCRGLRTNPDR